jgi:hypothetical protein
MKRVTLIATAVVLAVLAVLATRVAAQETNTSERTFLTFSSAVEMPGVTLPAGTYVFKLADTPTRNVVQVWDKDEKNMVGHWLFVQSERPQVSGDTVVMFKETREGATPAVQYWYFPGERIGKEFVYPKDQAQRIAARTGLDVRSEDGVIEGSGIASVETEPAAVAAAAPAPAAEPAPVAAAEPAPQAAASAEVERAPAPAAEVNTQVAASADTSDRSVGTSGAAEGQIARNDSADQLPRTASPLALNGLLGLLSLAGAAGLRLARK